MKARNSKRETLCNERPLAIKVLTGINRKLIFICHVSSERKR